MKAPGLVRAQRDRGAVEANLERIATERAAQEYELGAFDEAEHHQPLHGRIRSLDRLDPGAVTGLEIRKCQASTPRKLRK
jgi:hypothetical protein